MKRMTTTTARKPTQRAFDDWRTTCAARSGGKSTFRIAGGEVNRSTGAGSAGSRGTGRRCSGSPSGGRSGVSLIGLLGASRGRDGSTSDAPGRRAWRDQARLAEGDGQWAERDLAGVDRKHAGPVDRDREPVHATRRRPELRAVRLDPEPVIARAMARTLEPEILEARIRLAAQVRAALV